MEKTKIFCLPFAGGTQYSYADYQRYCPPEIELHPVDLPGRGKRVGEDCLSDIADMADAVLATIKDKLDRPYAIYGHSLGGIIGYVLCQKLKAANLPMPVKFFVSGRTAPSAPRRKPLIHHLDRGEFFAKLKELGGMPELILQNQELLDFFEPILKADLKAAETYQYTHTEVFDLPITVMIGSEEEILEEDALAWQKETTYPLDLRVFEGNHFFISKYPKEIVQVLASEIATIFKLSANAI